MPAAQHQLESNDTGRLWRRFRFRLRTLLLIPVVASVLLFLTFPKLLTGDFVEARVVSIESDGSDVRIRLDARISSGTGWGTTLYGGSFGSCVVGSKSQSHWSQIIPTWPKHKFIHIKLGLRSDRLAEKTNPEGMLAIQQGMTYRVTTGQPLELAPNSCRFHVRRGSRFGL
jgi:hypothetical protein